MATHTHRDTYSQSRVLTWHGTVPPSVSPLDKTWYALGVDKNSWLCLQCSQTYSNLPMDKITAGIITNSKSPENPGKRTDTLAVPILLTMPVLAHTLWVGVNICEQLMNHISLNKKHRPRCYGKSTTACAGHVSPNTRPHRLLGWGPLSAVRMHGDHYQQSGWGPLSAVGMGTITLCTKHRPQTGGWQIPYSLYNSGHSNCPDTSIMNFSSL